MQTEDKEMSLVDHLGELRKRIIWVLVVLSVSMIVGLIAAEPVINYMKEVGPAAEITWNVFSPWDAIRVYMQFAFVVGLLITLPFAMYHIWMFVKPGLRQEEQKAALRYIPGAALLLLVGLAFGYFVVFPMAFYLTTMMTERLQLTQTYGISQYFSFMFNIIIPLSVFFELPLVVMFLTRLRILNPMMMHRIRRHAYLGLLIVGAMITPPDLVSDVIVTIPLVILYEFSLLLCRMVYRKMEEMDRAREAEFGP